MAQRILPGLVLGLAAVGSAAAQAQDDLRWRGGAPRLGLAPQRAAFQVACGTVAFPCDGATALRLYSAPSMTRTLDLQLANLDLPRDHRWGPAPGQGLNVSVVGRASLAGDFGVYGRLGTWLVRPPPALAAAHLAAADGGMGRSYGVGVSWDFSPRGSATLGIDSYDLRFAGEREPVRSTSLGLQWRY